MEYVYNVYFLLVSWLDLLLIGEVFYTITSEPVKAFSRNYLPTGGTVWRSLLHLLNCIKENSGIVAVHPKYRAEKFPPGSSHMLPLDQGKRFIPISSTFNCVKFINSWNEPCSSQHTQLTKRSFSSLKTGSVKKWSVSGIYGKLLRWCCDIY